MISNDSLLGRIQALQYRDKAAAEALLRTFVMDTFPMLVVQQVELRPSAVSLNSFNGYLTLTDGQRLFFKTHVEPASVIGEYYNSALLAEAGYPVIRPRYASTEYGKQFLIYDLIDSPSVFDLARQLELGQPAACSADKLTVLQNTADDHLFQIYSQTLAEQSALDSARAPVHQLFYHRLAGERYKSFYGESAPNDGATLVNRTLDKRWTINGRRYQSTLRELIDRQKLIAPDQAGISVIGHGDAHNGNIFAIGHGLVYFDPAFAGRHNPFLDLAKPLFHNVFASWMYFPVAHPQAETLIIHADTADSLRVEFDEALPTVRQMFFASKAERVLRPLLIELQRQRKLPVQWRSYLKMALFCCPLLTMNLIDSSRFPEKTAWLGLSYALIMGSESEGSVRSLLDHMLDDMER